MVAGGPVARATLSGLTPSGVAHTEPMAATWADAACSRCGTTRDPSGPDVLAWASEREPDGRVSLLCPACARRHARDIEARLPPEWW